MKLIGMANYNKNVFVGTGGPEGINKSHFLGAVYGMERIMGRADNPVRRVYNYASDHCSGSLPPIVYVLTVVGRGSDGSSKYAASTSATISNVSTGRRNFLLK